MGGSRPFLEKENESERFFFLPLKNPTALLESLWRGSRGKNQSGASGAERVPGQPLTRK